MLSAIIINEVIRVDLVVFLAIFAGELLAPPPPRMLLADDSSLTLSLSQTLLPSPVSVSHC